MTAIAQRWRALNPRWRVAAVVAGAVLAGNLVVYGVSGWVTGNQPRGKPSSSYATIGRGVAAYATILRDAGHPVSRLRTAPSDTDLPPEATVVVLDPPTLSPADRTALAEFVTAGGRLIAGGFGGVRELTSTLVDPRPQWSVRAVATAHAIVPVAETAGVGRVRSAGNGSWRSTGAGLPIVASPVGSLAFVTDVGRGRAVFLADTSPITNEFLARGDNAAFAIAIAGPTDRTVIFDEAVHGYGGATGLRAIPARWRWALAGVLVAVVVWMLAHARRLGPPERPARDLPPSRRLYVDAVASTLGRTRQPRAALANVRTEARARLAFRAGIAVDAADEDLRRAALALGVDRADIDAVLGGGDDPVAIARALVHVAGSRVGDQ